MGNNSTALDRVELDRPEDAVTIRVNSNEQLIETHIEQIITAANRKGCNIRNILILVIAVLAVSLVAESAIIIHLANWNPESKESSSATQASRFRTDLNANDGIDLRINAENSSCERPSCIICKTEVMPHLEAFHCAEPGANVKNGVKNGTCFLCEGKCMTLQGLLDKVKENETHVCKKPKIELTCCKLSIMGNLAHYCGGEGRYLCFNEKVHDHHNQSVHEPICRCPPGSLSKQCNKTYTEAADCRCFKSTHKFYGQEQITQCDNVTANWSTCHMTISELGEEYNCLCDKSTGTKDLG